MLPLAEKDEVAASEELIGSNGGLGGTHQTFFCHPPEQKTFLM